jgi:hypothetical protein
MVVRARLLSVLGFSFNALTPGALFVLISPNESTWVLAQHSVGEGHAYDHNLSLGQTWANELRSVACDRTSCSRLPSALPTPFRRLRWVACSPAGCSDHTAYCLGTQRTSWGASGDALGLDLGRGRLGDGGLVQAT